jgi:hypothetical protein
MVKPCSKFGEEGTVRRLLVAVLLLSTPLFAQAPEEWDVERRLAERFDDRMNAERIAIAREKSPNLGLDWEREAPGSRHYLIVGWRNPELFLPHELFETLLSADVSGRDSYGATLRAAYGEDFDRFLYEVIAPRARKTYLIPVTTASLRDEARGCP